VAQYRKQRQKELKKDAFRDSTLNIIEKIGDRLEGKGPLIIKIAAALVAAILIFSVLSWYRGKKKDEALRALGRVIEFANAQITETPPAGGDAAPTFKTEKDRAQRVVEEAAKVIAKYGDPYREKARYFSAVNQLALDRNKGISELEELAKSGEEEVATWSKFAVAQAKEVDGQYGVAANYYQELINKSGSATLPIDTIKFRLASVYQKQGKNNEAAELLYKLVEESRKPKDGKEGSEPRRSVVADDAAKKLEILDPAKYAALPTPAPMSSFPM
jgi:tetratricopeptide (TPR) repeat protein